LSVQKLPEFIALGMSNNIVMSGNKNLSKQVEDFLELAGMALKTMDEGIIQRLRTSTESFIIFNLGKESVFYRNYTRIDKWSSIVNLKQIAGLLLALKDHLDSLESSDGFGELSYLLLGQFYQNTYNNLDSIRNLIKNNSDYFHFNESEAVAIFNRFKEKGIIAFTGNGQAYVITKEGKKLYERLSGQHSVKEIISMTKLSAPKRAGPWDAFLCHSSIDKNTVRKIMEDLEARGVSCWFDEREIQPGDNIIDKISNGLLHSRNIVPFISRDQLQSGWARNEYESVLARIITQTTSQRIIPVVLDYTPHDDIPLFLTNYRFERYLDPVEYERFLNYLEKVKV